MDVTASIVFAGVANAAILSLVSALNRRKHPAAAWLCASLALLSAAAAAILIQHRLDGVGERLAVTVEHIATYSAPPTLYLYVRVALGKDTGRGPWLHFIPAAAYLLFGAPLTALGVAEPPPFELTVTYMIAYSAASLTLVTRSWIREGFGPRLTWPMAILATMAAIHGGQLVRLTSDSPAVQDIVALAGALAVFGLLALALAGLVPWAVSKGGQYSRSSASMDELRAKFATLNRVIEEQQLFRRPDLRLADVAEAAGLSSHEASQALSMGGRISFHELIANFRIEEARRLLEQPENARVSVEPIGMMAGFRSRSAFYEAFHKAARMTPAEYRRRAHPELSCPGQPEGTGKK